MTKMYLTFKNRSHKGQTYQVFDETTLGRSEDCELPVQDTATSSAHCRFFVSKEGVSIRDLRSTNGTTVNGHRVSTVNLKSGDDIRVGETTFSVEIMGADEDAGYKPLPAFLCVPIVGSFSANGATQQLAY